MTKTVALRKNKNKNKNTEVQKDFQYDFKMPAKQVPNVEHSALGKQFRPSS